MNFYCGLIHFANIQNIMQITKSVQNYGFTTSRYLSVWMVCGGKSVEGWVKFFCGKWKKTLTLRGISKAMTHGYDSSSSMRVSSPSFLAKPHRKVVGFDSESHDFCTLSASFATCCRPIDAPANRVFYLMCNIPLYS